PACDRHGAADDPDALVTGSEPRATDRYVCGSSGERRWARCFSLRIVSSVLFRGLEGPEQRHSQAGLPRCPPYRRVLRLAGLLGLLRRITGPEGLPLAIAPPLLVCQGARITAEGLP